MFTAASPMTQNQRMTDSIHLKILLATFAGWVSREQIEGGYARESNLGSRASLLAWSDAMLRPIEEIQCPRDFEPVSPCCCSWSRFLARAPSRYKSRKSAA
jgi:hypothetical protein